MTPTSQTGHLGRGFVPSPLSQGGLAQAEGGQVCLKSRDSGFPPPQQRHGHAAGRLFPGRGAPLSLDVVRLPVPHCLPMCQTCFPAQWLAVVWLKFTGFFYLWDWLKK